jgi:hypothetical protein
MHVPTLIYLILYEQVEEIRAGTSDETFVLGLEPLAAKNVFCVLKD